MAKVGRPLKFQSVEELQTKIDAYFVDIPETEWTWTGLAMYLVTDKETLADYRDRDRGEKQRKLSINLQ